jgi:hypothetical protein
MSDYFLNKIYDSLLVNKPPKTKSTFRTLSESYGLVYEEEIETTPEQQEQPNAQDDKQEQPNAQEDNSEKKQTNILINVNQPVLQTTQWVGVQQDLYNKDANKDDESKTGVGPGEYAIASVISGVTEKNALQNFISGQSESFDVSWPSKDEPTYKFEVKKEEGSSVRIGKLGHVMGGYMQQTVGNITQTLLQEYNNLNDDQKEFVNKSIQEKIPKIEGTKLLARARGRKAYMDNRINNWTLNGFIDAITDNMIELPRNMMFGDETKPNYKLYNTDYKYPNSKKFPVRAQYLIFSIKRLLQIINDLANTESTTNDTESSKELAITFKRFYSAPSNEKGKEFENYLDREAVKTDRRLSKQLCKTTGVGCENVPNFFTAIQQEGLYEDILQAEKYINDPVNIRNLFPKEQGLTGLFVVSSQGWKYVPSDKIGTLVRIDTISQGKPKIILAGNPSQEDVAEEA